MHSRPYMMRKKTTDKYSKELAADDNQTEMEKAKGFFFVKLIF